MPFEITLKDLGVGYAASSARNGENVSVIVREFTSSEDGDLFISRLEGIPSAIIAALPRESQVKSSTVDRLLAIIRRDETATVYVNNELRLLVEFLIKGRDIEAGQPIFSNDIADIRKLTFHEITVPVDAGMVFLFSQGWRKGLYYDLRPLVPPEFAAREYDLENLCGQFFAYVAFQHLFKLTDAEWNALIGQKWFPFVSLKNETIKTIITHARNGWDIDEITESIASELTSILPSILKKLRRNTLFGSHLQLFEQAIDRYLAGDYISTASILYPRIEGLMRTYLASSGKRVRPSPKHLVKSVIEATAKDLHHFSRFLPNNFQRYLEEVYFANFDPQNPDVLSRHSVAHGVAPAHDFSLKAATIGLLILDQLSFYLRPQDSENN